jgi:L-cystine uptake protein TcyP (sodium:dicarboxylate symporter family)
MNIKLIIFSGIVTAIIGSVIGVGTAKITANRYTSTIYQNVDTTYAEIGLVTGLLVGTSQETLRQLKKQRDREEDIERKLEEILKIQS